MRVLVVVGEIEPPERLVVRADRVLHTAGPELEPQLLADVRAHIPEDVAVVGAAGRSFTLPPPLRNSHLASRWQSRRRPMRSRRTSGVLPTRSRRESATSMAGPVSVSARMRSPSGSAGGWSV